MKEIIQFVHANGFPAKTYNKIFSLLEDDFDIRFIERHGHDPAFPVTNNWKYLVEELHREIVENYQKPIIGVGHSFGGILHLLLAAENPELYKSIILLDAPIISRTSSLAIKLAKKIDLMKKFSPANSTRFRRSHWKTEDEAFEHFRRKEKFRAFEEDVLRDYVKYGTESFEKGIRLTFKPAIETRIYETLPDDLPSLRGRLKIPISYIGGLDSQEARLARINFMKKYFPINFHFIKGSHLFPFEKPQLTADLIKKTTL